MSVITAHGPRTAGVKPADPENEAEAAGLDVGVLTLVLWIGCMGVGLFGFGCPYPRPKPAKAPESPLVIQQLQVELAPDLRPTPEPTPTSAAVLTTPPAVAALKLPEVPKLVEVAQAIAAAAFPLPVNLPTQIIEPGRAEQLRVAAENPNPSVAKPPSPQHLTYGEGEGKQIAPPYPRRAIQLRQEGTVIVRITVNSEGVVRSAEAITPSPWPLLNESALRTVRERWKFLPGPPRVYDVPIRFELSE